MAILFAAGAVFTLAAMTVLRSLKWGDADPAKRRAARVQTPIALLAFAIWAYAQGGIVVVWTVQLGSYTGPALHDGVAALLAIAVGFLLLVSNKLAGTP